MLRACVDAVKVGSSVRQFNSLSLEPALVDLLRCQGLNNATEIQKLAIPRILERTKNIIINAETGSGKTLAYMIPLLANPAITARAVVIVPNKDLAMQACTVFNSLGGPLGRKASLWDFRPHISKDNAESWVLVCTPTQAAKSFDFDNVLLRCSYLVMDEVDSLFSVLISLQFITPVLPNTINRHSKTL